MENILNSTKVEKQFVKQRLDKFLSAQFPDLSRERIKTLIANASVQNAEGITLTSPSYKIKEGEIFTIEIPENKPLDIQAENIPLDILFEDDYLIIINKPAGMSVHPAGPMVSGTLVNALLYHCKNLSGTNLSGIGGVERPGIVHRLDKGTSGVMVVAKEDKTHQALTKMFQERTMERNYLALCYGIPRLINKRIETNISRHPKDRKKMAVVEKGGKEAITTFEILETFGEEASLLKFKLYTGRTHQIRVHANHINHSIISDPVYGKPKKLSNPEAYNIAKSIDHQMLHATILGFTHPITGEELRFEEPMPADMQSLYLSLKNKS
ncbi:MAG: RluA family pseudouridine synthase [Magnetococcales bacterium]|nr:RluA family pseudouridine synthase [Magnetococcales bacterium]